MQSTLHLNSVFLHAGMESYIDILQIQEPAKRPSSPLNNIKSGFFQNKYVSLPFLRPSFKGHTNYGKNKNGISILYLDVYSHRFNSISQYLF